MSRDYLDPSDFDALANGDPPGAVMRVCDDCSAQRHADKETIRHLREALKRYAGASDGPPPWFGVMAWGETDYWVIERTPNPDSDEEEIWSLLCQCHNRAIADDVIDAMTAKFPGGR